MRGLTVALMLALAGRADANPDPALEKRAAVLFEAGRDRAKAGDFATACGNFRDSLALVDAVGTRLNLADCLEHLGKLAEAAQLFGDAASADAATFPERAKMARDRADKLTGRLVTIVVHVPQPEGATITVAGVARPAKAEEIFRTDPGAIDVRIDGGGRTPFTQSVTGTEGQRLVVEAPAGEALAARVTPGEPGLHRRKSRVYLALGVGGAGVVTFIIGEAMALSAKGAYQDELDSGGCEEKGGSLTCRDPAARARVVDANDRATIATVVVLAGAALAVTGIVTFVTAPKERATIVPTASSSSIGLAVVGRF